MVEGYLVGNAGGMTLAPRLSEVLFERANRSFASLAPLPSNVEAVEAALLFSAGLRPLVALVGPSGWGKTHLLDAVAYRLSQEGMRTEPFTATDFLANQGRLDATAPLLLDDVQEVLGKPRQRLMLRLALERRVRAGRRTILAFTLPGPTRGVRAFLPSSREWTLASMAAPSSGERVPLLNQMAAAEGLALSPALARVLATSMQGNGRTLCGALKRLRLAGTEWLDPRAALRACGVLDPFFADNSGWDLKMKIRKAADAHRARFSRVSAMDLALYTMLHEACLGEADVARFMSLEPAEAYLRASRFEKEAQADPTVAAYVRQFVDIVVEALAAE